MFPPYIALKVRNRRNKKFRSIALMLAVFSIPCLPVNSTFAEQGIQSWSLSRLISRAYESSSELKISDADRIGAEAAATQAGRWDNPEVSLSGGPKNVSIVPGKTFEITVTQNVPLFGQKGAAANFERQNQRLSEENHNQSRIRLSHIILQNAYALAAVEEHARHAEHRRNGINLIGQYLRTRPFASPSQAVEKSLIQNRIREIDEKFSEIGSLRLQAWNELNLNLGLSERVSPAVKWVDKPIDLNEVEFRAAIMKNHPELQKQLIAVDRANAQMSVANRRVFPDVKLGAGYAYEMVELPETSYFGMVSMTLPLWDSGGSARRAAEARQVAEDSRLSYIRTQTSNEFDKAWAEYNEAKKRLELFPLKLIPALEADMQRAEANWRRGLVPATAFLELEDQVHGQADHVYEAQTAYIKAMSNLYYLAGKPAPEELVKSGER